MIANPVVFFLVACAFSAISAQTLVPGIDRGQVPRLQPRTSAQTCSKIGGECTADCKTFMICSVIGNAPDSTRQCSGERPYCNANACSATPDPRNAFCAGTPVTTFTCTGAGIFPDPNSCSQYFNCPSAADNAVLFECPVGSVFDSHVQSCVLTNSKQLMKRTFTAVKTCSPTKCPRNFVGFVPYKSNPIFFVHCFEDKRMVFKCADPQNQVFDAKVDPEKCSFKCKAAGHFKDRQNCNKFYTCTKKGLSFKVDHNTCPPLYWFNNGACEPQGATPCVPEIV